MCTPGCTTPAPTTATIGRDGSQPSPICAPPRTWSAPGCATSSTHNVPPPLAIIRGLRLRGDDPPPTRPAKLALTALRGRWGQAAVLKAAWDDLQDACRDPQTDADTVAVRRDLLWQLHAGVSAARGCRILARDDPVTALGDPDL